MRPSPENTLGYAGAQLIDTTNKAVLQTCILTLEARPAAFVVPSYMKFTSDQSLFQDVYVMNILSYD